MAWKPIRDRRYLLKKCLIQIIGDKKVFGMITV